VIKSQGLIAAGELLQEAIDLGNAPGGILALTNTWVGFLHVHIFFFALSIPKHIILVRY
jgi:hypothetical protein